MKNTLHKTLSLLLTLILTFSLAAPAFAAVVAVQDTSTRIESVYFTSSADTSNPINEGTSGIKYIIYGELGDNYANYNGQAVQIATADVAYGDGTQVDPIKNSTTVNNEISYGCYVHNGKFSYEFTAPDVKESVNFDFGIRIYDSTGAYYVESTGNTFTVNPETVNAVYMYINNQKIDSNGTNSSSNRYVINTGTTYTLSGKYTTGTDTVTEIDCGDTTTWAKNGSISLSNTTGQTTSFTTPFNAIDFDVTITYTNGCGDSKSQTIYFSSVKGPIISEPTADTSYYYYRNSNTGPTLTISCGSPTGVDYQWYKIVTQADGSDTLTAISDATDASYPVANPSEGSTSTTNYCCIVTDQSSHATTQSKTFTVNYIDEYEVSILDTQATQTVKVGESVTVSVTAKYYEISSDHTSSSETQFPSNMLMYCGASNNTYVAMGTASGTNYETRNITTSSISAVKTGSAEFTVYGVKENSTAIPLDIYVNGYSDVTKHATANITVTQLDQISVSATVPSNGAEFSMIATNELTTKSVSDQISSLFGTNPEVSYVQFESFTNNYGTLSTSSTSAKYYLKNAPTGQRTISEVTYTPNGTPGTDTYIMHAFSGTNTYTDSDNNTTTPNLEKIVTLTIKSSKNLTGVIDIAYNVKTSSTTAIDEQDFIDWFLDQDTQYTALKSVSFSGSPTHGSLVYGTSLTSAGTSEYYTSTGASSTSAKLLSNVKFKAGTTKGSDGFEFTATGTNSSGKTVTETGVVYFCVVSKDISDISYNVKYGTNTQLSETDFNKVYNAAGGYTSNQSYTIQFIKTPEYGNLYRYNTQSSTYKISANDPVNLYANLTGTERTNSTHNLGDVIYVPIALASGDIQAEYAAYNSGGELVYIGTVTFVYNAGDQKFSCGAEGYKFSISDFVNSSDSDPIVSVSFTPLASSASGKLYYDYANGKGTLITGIEKFSTTTGGTISSVVYIPNASNPVNQDITYSATTKSGKSISATVTIKYVTRTVSQKFTDVKDSWAIPGVDFCSAWGIANGTGGTTFTPNGTMQRCMLVSMLYRMAGSPNVSISNPFKDVSVNDYYYAAVLWAYSKQIVTGTTSTTFSPTAAVTRQDIATMLWRYAGCPSASATYVNKYSDSNSISSYATQPMSWAVSQGIITGSNNKLTPTASGTRAQVAAMLHRYLAK